MLNNLTKKWIIGVMIFLITTCFIIIKLELYPVAFAPKWFISAREFNKIIASLLNYYEKSFAVYTTSTFVLDIGAQKEIKRAALDKLIEDRIIDEILRKNLGSDLEKIVKDKMTNLQMSDNLAKASQILYNLSLEDFRRLVLIPQAKKEILEERGIDLEEIKKSSRPVILIPGFYWQNEVLSRD